MMHISARSGRALLTPRSISQASIRSSYMYSVSGTQGMTFYVSMEWLLLRSIVHPVSLPYCECGDAPTER